MTDISGWRRAYNAVERNVSPRVEALVHSDEFAQMTTVIARTRRVAGTRVNAELRLVVDPARRRFGVGSALARHALVEAVHAGPRKLVVELAADQQNALAMFSSLGFTGEGSQRGAP